MELNVIEEDALGFWQDQGFRDMFSGCKHINAILFGKGKHIFLTPVSVTFEQWEIGLDQKYAESLAVVVDIIPRVDS